MSAESGTSNNIMTPPSTHSTPSTSSRGRVGPNLIANAVNLAVTALVTLWFTPYLTRKLGISGYGLVALAISLLPYLALSTAVLNSALNRHVTVHLERRDYLRANQTLNTCVWGSLLLAALLMPLAILVVAHADVLFQTPPGYITDLKLLLFCVVGVSLLTTFGLPFQVATVSRNRLDILSGISLVHTLARTGLVVLIFQFAAPKAWHVGAALVVGFVWSVAATITAWRILTPYLRLSWRMVTRSALSELTSTGGWAVVESIGWLLFFSTELVIVNRMLGPDTAGKYAAVLQWPLLIRTAVFAIAPAFLPPMFYMFARRDMAGLAERCRHSIRLVGLMSAILVGLVCGFSRPLLGLWLGKEMVSLAPLLVLMTAPIALNLSTQPLLGLQLAANRVKAPAIATLILGAINVVAAIWLAGPRGLGVYGVAAAMAATLAVRMLLFGPLYAGRTLGATSAPIYAELLFIAFAALSVWAAARLACLVFALNNWASLIGAASAILGLFALALLPLIRSKQGRGSLQFLFSDLHAQEAAP